MTAPDISASDLLDFAKRLFPASKLTHSSINPEHRSWSVTVGGKEEARWLEFFWGPLSGFGATDLKRLPKGDLDIFSPYEVSFSSAAEAKLWLQEKAKKEPNQTPEPTAAAGRGSS